MNERHTGWCAQGHHCAVVLGEHRAEPILIRVHGAGTAVLTRVQDATGVEYAEIRMRVSLPAQEPHARARLATLLSQLRTLIGSRR